MIFVRFYHKIKNPLSRMSLSEAYGGKPSYAVLTLDQFRKDMELMGEKDRLVYDCKIAVDDDLQLSDLICTIKNLPYQENASNLVIAVPETLQP